MTLQLMLLCHDPCQLHYIVFDVFPSRNTSYSLQLMKLLIKMSHPYACRRERNNDILEIRRGFPFATYVSVTNEKAGKDFRFLVNRRY